MDDQMPDVMSRLIESEERYRAFIDNASDMIQSVRPDGTFEFVNPAWFRRMGYAPHELAHLTIWDVIHPGSHPHCQELFRVVLQGQAIEHVEAMFVAKDRTAFPIEGNATPRLVNGTVVATHSFFRDVTERQRARELEERNARLERERQARYLEKMAALGKLSAGLSHELNNPASAAQRAGAQLHESLARRDAAARALLAGGVATSVWEVLEAMVAAARPALADTGERDPLADSDAEERVSDWLEGHGIARAWEIAPRLVRGHIDQAALESLAARVPPPLLPSAAAWLGESLTLLDMTEVVARSTHRISELVGAVKSYSHMDRAREQDVDVHDGIEDTLIILGHRLRTIEVRRRYDRALPRVRAFGNTLNQVWTNIIDNAIDAMSGEGTLTIVTRRDGDRVIVELCDSGAGIPAEHLSRVFEPFFSTKPQGHGLGLGLDTVWRIVTEEQGGTLDVESEPGRTVMRVSLPVAPAAPHGEQGTDDTNPRGRAENRAG